MWARIYSKLNLKGRIVLSRLYYLCPSTFTSSLTLAAPADGLAEVRDAGGDTLAWIRPPAPTAPTPSLPTLPPPSSVFCYKPIPATGSCAGPPARSLLGCRPPLAGCGGSASSLDVAETSKQARILLLAKLKPELDSSTLMMEIRNIKKTIRDYLDHLKSTAHDLYSATVLEVEASHFTTKELNWQ